VIVILQKGVLLHGGIETVVCMKMLFWLTSSVHRKLLVQVRPKRSMHILKCP